MLTRVREATLRQCFGAAAPLLELVKDAPTNGWPLSCVALRAGFLQLACDSSWWRAQITDTVQDVVKLLGQRKARDWKTGRMILLALRARNSKPTLFVNLPASDAEAYTELKERYTNDRRSAAGRIAAIERDVPARERWR